ncbi:MAG: hypothetical protein IH849_02825 [Acidobacteria bacterium]|nr:hypothetical protein [Acidobacteriota bacterium]
MLKILAYSAFALTVSLSVTRPRLGRGWQIGPAQAATGSVLLLLVGGVVDVTDIASAAGTLWRPFITIVSIMITTAAAHRLGVLSRVGEMIFSRADSSVTSLFSAVFFLSVLTSSVLNNDAAVLLLTPLVLALVDDRYPDEPRLRMPFAFAVFTAVGVAPFVVSNPMNMIVASRANLNFNEYAARMLPIAIIGWLIAFVILRVLFASQLKVSSPGARRDRSPTGLDATQRWMLVLLLAVVGSYPIVASIDGDAIWMVSAAGAVLAVLLASRLGGVKAGELLVRGVAWPILAFLLAVFVLGIGLRNVGFVDQLAAVYQNASLLVIGTTAALGSAALNNHPMAIINLLALESTPGAGQREILAVLVGGDLGPRLLPIGSLAGLLWLDACRRHRVEISLSQFVKVGILVTVPTLAASLLILQLW